jgi:hypothetical protein
MYMCVGGINVACFYSFLFDIETVLTEQSGTCFSCNFPKRIFVLSITNLYLFYILNLFTFAFFTL